MSDLLNSVVSQGLASSGVGSDSTNKSGEMTMLEIQLLIAKEFDDQLRHAADQIDMLSKIKKTYRERINTLSKFLAKPVVTERGDKQPLIRASASEMAEFAGALTTTDYNLEALKFSDQAMMISDRADKHEMDTKSTEQLYNEAYASTKTNGTSQPGVSKWDAQHPIASQKQQQDKVAPAIDPSQQGHSIFGDGGVAVKNTDGQSSAGDIVDLFSTCASITDPEVAMAFAKNIPDIGKKGGDSDLPFLFGTKNNKDENGFPIFHILKDSISQFSEQLKNKLTDVEEDSEKLTTKLNQLMKMKEEVMNSATQTLKKEEEVRSGVLSKLSA